HRRMIHITSHQINFQLPFLLRRRFDQPALHSTSAPHRQPRLLVGAHLVVEYGSGTKIRQGNNLDFLHQHQHLSFVAVLRLWAMYDEGECVFIVIEHFKGEYSPRHLALVASLPQ
ncbi:hypothetical protein A1O7_08354, partial [Cladophialophora yegresii CBS 114405]